MEQIIKENKNWGLLSKSKLYLRVKDLGISKQEVSDYLENKEIYQIYKKQPKKTKLKITAPPYSFQIDVVFIKEFKKQNKTDKFLLMVDILSRKAYALPLKNGKMSDVLKKYEDLIIQIDEPINSVSGDNFFENEVFKTFNEVLQINVFTDIAKSDHITRSSNKLGILDRSVRTIKNLIQKKMIATDNTKWVSYLQDILDLYNSNNHSGIKDMTPNEVFDDPDYCLALYKNQKSENKKEFKKVSIDIGDTVRIMEGKAKFSKEKQRFSSELYIVNNIEGYKYVVEDLDRNELKRRYKPNELYKVKDLVDRVNKSKNKKKEEKEYRNKLRFDREGLN
jgi:hypothetical protein